MMGGKNGNGRVLPHYGGKIENGRGASPKVKMEGSVTEIAELFKHSKYSWHAI